MAQRVFGYDDGDISSTPSGDYCECEEWESLLSTYKPQNREELVVLALNQFMISSGFSLHIPPDYDEVSNSESLLTCFWQNCHSTSC